MDPEQEELDRALKFLLDNDLVSMTWDDEREEIAFFMTSEQKAIYDLENPWE